MCGTAWAAWPAAAACPSVWPSVLRQVQRRGDDAWGSADVVLDAWRVSLHASVLGLRGPSVVQQPLVSHDEQLWLTWNGEIFEAEDPALVDQSLNDTQQLFDCWKGAFSEARLVHTLAHVDGPYAFVLLDAHWLASAASVESVQAQVPWTEVPCTSLWRLPLRTNGGPVALERCSPYALRLELAPPSLERSMAEALPQLEQVLCESVRIRIQGLGHASCPAPVALLFSGGLDCTVLASLVAEYLPPEYAIDLINVAFENPRSIAAAWASGAHAEPGTFPHDKYAVPDRLAARRSAEDLRRLYPARTWNMVEVDVPYSEYEAHTQTVQALMHPSATVMDLSIACALYFAARGEGHVDGRSYRSPARVLLSGLGADELLGGYARHRQAWRRGGNEALTAELQLDLDRLPTRNLGRDDRVLSAHSREARYPYLARSVRAFLAALPVQAKTDMADELGDKKLLRLLAQQRGLSYAAALPKRAIQFGARSAKMDAQGARLKGTAPMASST
ncbi:hypothetical protein MCAP1_003369 [Malassezia caprae]|uniref:Asparagine synthetase domain-containing protein n=1 Tax=Malassezia caprae TaxID=1381934 RepID=A0AAF0IXJ9_9BASI|nr:hypothetical protein MCAP1_003369 [Malassezia caprae]